MAAAAPPKGRPPEGGAGATEVGVDSVEKHLVCTEAELARSGRRHTVVAGRSISVIAVGDAIHAIDTKCYHAGGPLAMGDIEDIEGRAALVCPWHHYHVTLDTGEKFYQGLDVKMNPCGWRSGGRRQRVHQAVRDNGSVYVLLDTDPVGRESDDYAIPGTGFDLAGT